MYAFAYIMRIVMKNKTGNSTAPKEEEVSYPLRVPKALDAEVERVARLVTLSKQATARQAMKLGLPKLLEALGQPVEKPTAEAPA